MVAECLLVHLVHSRCSTAGGIWRIMQPMRQDKDKPTLFTQAEEARIKAVAPLAVRMRPVSLDEFVGQEHFVGRGKLLRRMLEADKLTSVIFYGPPGTGKTSLARVIANLTKAHFHYISAPAASVKDIRQIINIAKGRLLDNSRKTVLFIDEIHRFSRAQQDVLLDDVESGVLTLIGATTENPFFTVNSPLISRSTIFRFEPLSKEDVMVLLKRAIGDAERGLGRFNIIAEPNALEFVAVMCGGDGRKALTALEVAVLSQAKGQAKEKPIKFDLETARESIQQKTIDYDGTGDTHYDLASALQKSMRGSDPDATVYWLARMIAGGEDPRFIARRIAVCAAEDVGNAEPMATVLAAAAVQIAEFVGLPEAQLPLAQAAIYIACAPKSNASSSAIWEAVADVKSGRTIPVPKHLKDSHYPAAKKAGFGTDYKYPHKFKGGFVVQDYLGADLGKKYYRPKEIGCEKNIKNYLQKLENLIKYYSNSNDASSKGQ